MPNQSIKSDAKATKPLRFRKKPIVIEAMQFDGSLNSAQVIQGWADVAELVHPWMGSVYRLAIPTREGSMIADPGDWVIKEPNPTADRRFYPCKPDIFEQTYEPAAPNPEREGS